MDVDPPETDIGRWAKQPSQEEGPARKRFHSDIELPLQPFRAHPTGPTLHYSPNTPFLFNVGRNQKVLFEPTKPPAESQFPKYDPAEWPTSTFLGVQEDWDMRDETESPARPMAARVSDGVEQNEPAIVGPESSSLKDSEAGSVRDGNGQASVAPEERKIATGAVSRVKKQRIRDAKELREGGRPYGDQGSLKTEHTYNLNMNPPSMRHSEIPALLLGYLQFFVNASVVVFVLYLAVQFVLTVRRDVEDKMAEASVDILQEISECSQLYLTNRCDPAFRVPAMDAACRAWDVCMRRDPTFVGRINVMAETFAGVLNSFVDNISWKTMAFTIITLSFLIILTNSALFNLRQKATPTPPSTPHHMYPALGQAPWLPNVHQNHSFPPQGYLQAMQPGYLGHDADQTDPQQTRLLGAPEDKKKGWRPWR